LPDVLTLPNGLTVLVETLPELQSTAYALLVPAGSAYDPPEQGGTASTLCDWITRGAGERDSRAISCELDRLGIDHNTTINVSHLSLTGSCLPGHLADALGLVGDFVRCPRLEDDEFEGALAGVEHELQGLEDDPRQKVMLELVRRFYPAPWHQPPEGNLGDLERITPESTRRFWSAHVRPQRAILGLAGRITLEDLRPTLERVFGPWERGTTPLPGYGSRGVTREHLTADSTQTQIGVAYPSVPYRDPDYYASWAAVSILSGGMSSRLFTEVREKRGLCYSVYASLSTLQATGAVLCYAGTTNERAQETLDVMLTELKRLAEGIAPEELRRAQALAKSTLVMQQESSASRARSLARDWYHLGRPTTVDEVQRAIERLTPETILDYVRRHPVDPCTIVTIGPQALRLPE
jgi:predicted Zn-dependent peptidase